MLAANSGIHVTCAPLLFHVSYPIIIPRGLPPALLHHIQCKGLFVLQMDVVMLPVWNKGPYSFLGLHGHLGLTYSYCCVVRGCSGLTILHPCCLRVWVSYDGVQATAQQGVVVMLPLYSLSIVLLWYCSL
jgi:hypothetical protein